jgi:hypothetical protein
MVIVLSFRASRWYIYVTMERYIEALVTNLYVTELAPQSVPIAQPVHCECVSETDPGCTRCPLKRQLGPELKRWFQQACGALNWCLTTTRYDISLALNRIMAHMSAPTVGALRAVIHCIQYLYCTRHLCLRVALDFGTAPSWVFFTDSDQSGNRELGNKLCSVASYVVLRNGMLILWKTTRNYFAVVDSDLSGPHADRSSGAAEIFAAAESTRPLLWLKHLTAELMIPFPSPIVLQVDATTAQAFINATARRSKLRHIDLAQEWCITLRDAKLFRATHVPGPENNADLGTKIQGAQGFCPHRDRMFFPLSLASLERASPHRSPWDPV